MDTDKHGLKAGKSNFFITGRHSLLNGQVFSRTNFFIRVYLCLSVVKIFRHLIIAAKWNTPGWTFNPRLGYRRGTREEPGLF
jgi:hypothetical protein